MSQEKNNARRFIINLDDDDDGWYRSWPRALWYCPEFIGEHFDTFLGMKKGVRRSEGTAAMLRGLRKDSVFVKTLIEMENTILVRKMIQLKGLKEGNFLPLWWIFFQASFPAPIPALSNPLSKPSHLLFCPKPCPSPRLSPFRSPDPSHFPSPCPRPCPRLCPKPCSRPCPKSQSQPQSQLNLSPYSSPNPSSVQRFITAIGLSQCLCLCS